MEDFKQYLNDDAEEEERAAAEQVRLGLSGLRIERKVAQVAAERKAWQQQKFWRNIAVVALLLTLVGAALFFFWEREKPAPSTNPPEQLKTPDQQPDITPQTPPTSNPRLKKNAPVAINQSPPPYPAPNIRGEQSDNTAWKALLDQIWYTDYPPAGLVVQAPFAGADQLLKARDFNNAYVQLQRLERNYPANDTLRFLKGYCLLEMGEGAEALTYFEQLEQRQPAWKMQLEWFRSLGLLLTGDSKTALNTFRKIASTPGHTYLQQSKKAVQLLE